MTVPLYVVQLGQNDYLYSGFYYVAAKDEKAALLKLRKEAGIHIGAKEINSTLNVVDVHIHKKAIVV